MIVCVAVVLAHVAAAAEGLDDGDVFAGEGMGEIG